MLIVGQNMHKRFTLLFNIKLCLHIWKFLSVHVSDKINWKRQYSNLFICCTHVFSVYGSIPKTTTHVSLSWDKALKPVQPCWCLYILTQLLNWHTIYLQFQMLNSGNTYTNVIFTLFAGWIWKTYRLLYTWSGHLGTSPNIVRYCTVNCIITFLLYIQLFKENATFKLHVVLIVLPCEQQNVTYIRFLKYMHLSLKRTSSYKHTHIHKQTNTGIPISVCKCTIYTYIWL